MAHKKVVPRAGARGEPLLLGLNPFWSELNSFLWNWTLFNSSEGPGKGPSYKEMDSNWFFKEKPGPGGKS